MPVLLGELAQHRRMQAAGTEVTVERTYQVQGLPTETELDVYNLVLASFPLVYGPLVLTNVSITEQKPGVWTATITYGSPASRGGEIRPLGSNPPETPPDAHAGFRLMSRDWQFSNQQVQRTHSRYTAGYADATGLHPGGLHDNAVNVVDGQPEGYETIIPVLTMTESWQIPAAMWTPTYARTVAGMIGTVNETPWRGWQDGEVRLAGVSASYKGGGYMEAQYQFDISLNEPAFKPVESLPAIAKKGWQYAWIEWWRQIENGESKSHPVRVFIEEVHRYADFSALGLGT